jgi:hypothetical protein
MPTHKNKPFESRGLSKEPATPRRRSYAPPRLVVYGDLRLLTRSAKGSTNTDVTNTKQAMG